MAPHKLTASLVSIATALALGGCASSAMPASTPTVELHADYPPYSRNSLVESATLIVEGTALSSEFTSTFPRFEGDTPEENPLHGLSEEEKQKEIDSATGVPTTVTTFLVEVAHRGKITSGDEIEIAQTGGLLNGTRYVLSEAVPLQKGSHYLLFAREGFDGAFVILGGSAGTYVSSDDGYIPVFPELAPFAKLQTDEIATLTK